MNIVLLVLGVLILTLKYQAVNLLGIDSNVVDWICLLVIIAICMLSIWIVDWDKEG